MAEHSLTKTVSKPYILLALLVCQTALLAEGLRVGVARTEITPPIGYVMGGYGAREGGSQGVHDPLFATIVVMKSGDESLALVSLDLRSFPSNRVVEALREKHGIAHTLLCSTHTHSGPLTWEDKTWPDPDHSWFEETEDKIIAAVAEAAVSLFEAQIHSNAGEVYLGHNRRVAKDSGGTRMLWRNETQEPTSPVDPRVGVVQISDKSGRTRVVLVNYACHAVILGPDNRQISADWPGFMRGKVEREISGAYCLFLQGAAGDINPFQDKQPVAEAGFEVARQAGEEIAGEVLRLLESPGQSSSNVNLTVRQDVLEIPHRWKPEQTIEVGVSTVLFGDEIALVGWPGEAFVDFQIQLADVSPVSRTLFAGYCFSAGGVWAGYFPTIEAAVKGGYGASYNTDVAVGTGERLVQLNVRRLNEMLGKLGEVPK